MADSPTLRDDSPLPRPHVDLNQSSPRAREFRRSCFQSFANSPLRCRSHVAIYLQFNNLGVQRIVQTAALELPHCIVSTNPTYSNRTKTGEITTANRKFVLKRGYRAIRPKASNRIFYITCNLLIRNQGFTSKDAVKRFRCCKAKTCDSLLFSELKSQT